MDLTKFQGVIPAFLTCYDIEGNIDVDQTIKLANYCYEKKVNGLYVTGSSAECIYLSKEERKLIMSTVAKEMKGKLTLIAHIGSTSTSESIELAKYAEECGYDAVSSIPPIYYKLSNSDIIKYWEDIMNAVNIPFIAYNIPQFTGVDVSGELFGQLLKNPKAIGIKNTSLPVLAIQQFKSIGGENCVVFNGPDEQFTAGRLMGADAGIGSTYTVMAELFVKMNSYIDENKYDKAMEIQSFVSNIIMEMLDMEGHLFAVLKGIMKLRGLDMGGVRSPLPNLTEKDEKNIKDINQRILDRISAL